MCCYTALITINSNITKTALQHHKFITTLLLGIIKFVITFISLTNTDLVYCSIMIYAKKLDFDSKCRNQISLNRLRHDY